MSILKVAYVPPPMVAPTASVSEAVRLMSERRVGGVLVVENGHLRGIFTQRDVMLRVVMMGRSPEKTQVAEVMTTPVQTITKEVHPSEALQLMLEKHCGHLPILDPQGKILGMVAIRKLLEREVEYLSRELDAMDQYLSNDGPGGD